MLNTATLVQEDYTGTIGIKHVSVRGRARPLRVLHVLEATLGGTLRYLENLSQSMQGTPFEFGFAFGSSRADSRLEPFLASISEQGWATFRIDMRREISVVNEFKSLLSLRRVIKTFRPDILHCHSSKAGVLGRFAAHSVKPAPMVIYSPHAVAAPLGKRYLYVERALKTMADGFIAVSDSEASDIVRYGLSRPWSTRVVYPAIDTQYFTPRDRHSAKLVLGLEDASVVLGIGRMTRQKNPLGFLRIFAGVRKSVPNAKAIWLGEGDLLEAFLCEADRMGLKEHVRVVPWQHDIRQYLAAADVLLGTSIYESFGYMIAEALAMNVPVVSSAVSGPMDILVGELADNTFPPEELDGATPMVIRLLLEPAYAREKGALGRPLIEQRFSKETMRTALSECYRSIVI